MSASPIVVWGAGAIGGTIGAHLIRAGHDVLFVDRAADHVAALARSGCRITGPIVEFRVPARALTPDRVEGPFETVLLAVKAQDTAAAVAALAPHLAAGGCVVSVQNGLNELVIADRIGEARTVGCFVNFGADYIEPGVIHYGGRGSVVVGEIDGRITERAERLQRLLLDFDERAILSANIFGFLWSKLAYGALLFATALTDAPIADVLDSRRHRPMLVALAREVVAIAHANGIALEPFDGFDPAAFSAAAGDAAASRSLDVLVAFNRRSAKTHSGIWRDIAVRRRPTEADAQLGPIVRLGRERGLEAPLTARLIELIRALESRKRVQGWDVLDELATELPRRASIEAARS
jgi:2-dehydropantoate 2-reductase